MNPKKIEQYTETIQIERDYTGGATPVIRVIVCVENSKRGDGCASFECESEMHAYALAGLLARCTGVVIV